jgi:hypothetical protein
MNQLTCHPPRRHTPTTNAFCALSYCFYYQILCESIFTIIAHLMYVLCAVYFEI